MMSSVKHLLDRFSLYYKMLQNVSRHVILNKQFISTILCAHSGYVRILLYFAT